MLDHCGAGRSHRRRKTPLIEAFVGIVTVMVWLIRDDRLLISIRNSFFSRSPFGKNSKVKRAQLGVVSGWVTDREVALGCA